MESQMFHCAVMLRNTNRCFIHDQVERRSTDEGMNKEYIKAVRKETLSSTYLE